MKITILGCAVAGFALASAPLHAQTADGLTIETIQTTISDHIESIQQKETDEGELFFVGQMTSTNGKEYTVVVSPFECTGSIARCKGVNIYVNFPATGVPTIQILQKILRYNDTHRRGRSYWFGQTVGVDFQIYLTDGAGVPYLNARIEEFKGVIADFIVHMNK